MTTIMKRSLPASILETTEGRRLATANGAAWRRWGPYLSERQWGTVREDYSPRGDAWDYFSHDQARSRGFDHEQRQKISPRKSVGASAQP